MAGEGMLRKEMDSQGVGAGQACWKIDGMDLGFSWRDCMSIKRCMIAGEGRIERMFTLWALYRIYPMRAGNHAFIAIVA